MDFSGYAKFGPDVQWVASSDDLTVACARSEAFYAEVCNYWPGLRDNALQLGYAGIRPTFSGPGQPAADFWIQGPAENGVPGLAKLLGIESLWLTALLVNGQRVHELLTPSDRCYRSS